MKLSNSIRKNILRVVRPFFCSSEHIMGDNIKIDYIDDDDFYFDRTDPFFGISVEILGSSIDFIDKIEFTAYFNSLSNFCMKAYFNGKNCKDELNVSVDFPIEIDSVPNTDCFIDIVEDNMDAFIKTCRKQKIHNDKVIAAKEKIENELGCIASLLEIDISSLEFVKEEVILDALVLYKENKFQG